MWIDGGLGLGEQARLEAETPSAFRPTAPSLSGFANNEVR